MPNETPSSTKRTPPFPPVANCTMYTNYDCCDEDLYKYATIKAHMILEERDPRIQASPEDLEKCFYKYAIEASGLPTLQLFKRITVKAAQELVDKFQELKLKKELEEKERIDYLISKRVSFFFKILEILKKDPALRGLIEAKISELQDTNIMDMAENLSSSIRQMAQAEQDEKKKADTVKKVLLGGVLFVTLGGGYALYSSGKSKKKIKRI